MKKYCKNCKYWQNQEENILGPIPEHCTYTLKIEDPLTGIVKEKYINWPNQHKEYNKNNDCEHFE